MMNYYEELDISPGASANEIRHAYKSLARLVHPDQCSDENLRRLAELQMTRLNEILRVLIDPEARRRYDAGLRSPEAWRKTEIEAQPPVRGGHRRFLVGLCAWLPPVAVAAIVLAALLYYGTESRQDAAIPTPAENSIARPGVTDAAFSPVAPHLIPDMPQARSLESHRAVAPLGSAESGAYPAAAPHQVMPEAPQSLAMRDESVLEASTVAARALPEARLPASLERADPPVERPVPSSPTLAGHWYYVPAGRSAATNGIYLPEYIELRVIESGGVLRGHYIARYRVTDRAIEPNVEFEFDGAGSAPDARFSWKGAGESTGNVSLRLVAVDRLDVSWMATHLSGELNLASGDAQLIRQKER